jgi:PHD/YefM family antitoxin component YafN of YafNO toxin-antitoxin module
VEELEETVAVLSDSGAVRALLEAREAAARGDVVRGVDAVRALLDERA